MINTYVYILVILKYKLVGITWYIYISYLISLLYSGFFIFERLEALTYINYLYFTDIKQ